MPAYRYLVHENGPALWPEHKPLAEVQLLREETPEEIWLAVYQGTARPPAGYVFRRDWWAAGAGTRYERGQLAAPFGRYISVDTGYKEKASNDPTGILVADLLPDYRLAIRMAAANRWPFPELSEGLMEIVNTWGIGDRLRGILIEDKGAGTSILQTLRASTDLGEVLVPFTPTTDKETRAKQASVWCRLGCVLLPAPGDLWLADLEDELFAFPQGAHDDMVDALSQLILYLEHILEHGYRLRKEAEETK